MLARFSPSACLTIEVGRDDQREDKNQRQRKYSVNCDHRQGLAMRWDPIGLERNEVLKSPRWEKLAGFDKGQRIAKKQHLHPREETERPCLVEQVGFMTLPLATKHRRKNKDQAALRKRSENRFGKIEIEKFDGRKKLLSGLERGGGVFWQKARKAFLEHRRDR
jgi:hypothetical protein